MATLDPSRFVVVASIALHLLAGGALAAIDAPEPEKIEIIEMQTVEIPKPPKPEPPKPPPPEVAPQPAPKAAPPAPKAAPPAPAAEPAAAPDFGFALGNADGPGGIAVAAAAPVAAPPPVRQAVAKKLSAPAPAPEDGCTDVADTKPKATSMPHPAYTEDARAAAIEGKVRVELTVDASGSVTDARVIEGLGHGLDEAAVAAVKGASFAPATHCGKPVSATFTVSIRFAL